MKVAVNCDKNSYLGSVYEINKTSRQIHLNGLLFLLLVLLKIICLQPKINIMWFKTQNIF